uniref:Uncharacterized protein n=1 Tax=Oceanimonas doudoroffii TaxID=84158 RepID=G5CZG3_9GAMM|nr:hypothetical protein [Oceanimonas doudoroffii]
MPDDHAGAERKYRESAQGPSHLVHPVNIPGLITKVREFVFFRPVKANEHLNRQANIEEARTAGHTTNMHTANPATFPQYLLAASLRSVTGFVDSGESWAGRSPSAADAGGNAPGSWR